MRPDLHVTLADGRQLGYAEVGRADGEPVLHLHGTPSSRLEGTAPTLQAAADDLGLRLIVLDRPGMGLSSWRRFTIVEFPSLLRHFADALRLERFALTAVSGGGKYACSCAWQLTDRLTRVALVSSTCSFDLPEAKATWSKEDRQAYTLAGRTPWLFRLYFAKLRRDIGKDPNALFTMFPELSPSDQTVLARQDVQALLQRDMAEAFRQGARGPAHDYTLEARPWGVPLGEIEVPVDIWYGDDDRLVSPEQSRILAEHLPKVTTHPVSGQGHLLLFTDHARDILQSVITT